MIYQIISDSLKISSRLYIWDETQWSFISNLNSLSGGSESYFFPIDDIAVKIFINKNDALFSMKLQSKAEQFKVGPKVKKYKKYGNVNKFKIESDKYKSYKTTKNNHLRLDHDIIYGYGYFTEVAELINNANKDEMKRKLSELKQKLIQCGLSTRDLGFKNLGFLKDRTLVCIDFSPSSQKN